MDKDRIQNARDVLHSILTVRSNTPNPDMPRIREGLKSVLDVLDVELGIAPRELKYDPLAVKQDPPEEAKPKKKRRGKTVGMAADDESATSEQS